MADLGTTSAPVESRPRESTSDHGRRVARRRSLPGGRAVAGALLITAAAVGVFGAWLDATAAPSTSFLVAAVDIAPGVRVSASMVTAVPMDLPAAQADAAFTSVADLDGALAVAPLEAGDLILHSALLEADAVPGTTTYTFAVAPTRALNGAIVDGERIDIIATQDGATRFVARDILVLDRAGTSTGDRVVLTVAVEDADLVLDIANAVDTATVHVARTDPDVASPATPTDGEVG